MDLVCWHPRSSFDVFPTVQAPSASQSSLKPSLISVIGRHGSGREMLVAVMFLANDVESPPPVCMFERRPRIPYIVMEEHGQFEVVQEKFVRTTDVQ